MESKYLLNSSKSKPIRFTRLDPTVSIKALLDEMHVDAMEHLRKLKDVIRRNESTKGWCGKMAGFYHYSDIPLAIEYLQGVIETSEQEIILSTLPPSLLSTIEQALHDAFLHDVKIHLYYSDLDIAGTPEYYLDNITRLLKRVGMRITKTRERACRIVRFNELLVPEGLILVDGKYLNSLTFHRDEILHVEGFPSKQFVQQTKSFLKMKTVVKELDIRYPVPYRTVLDIIRENKGISTKDLGIHAGMSGSNLREILDFLVKEGEITEKTVIDGPGRPRKTYSLVQA